MLDTQLFAGCANIGLVNGGGRRQPDGMSEANLRRPTTHRASWLVKKSLKPKYFLDFFQLTLKR